jgi:hypothetical protein
VNKESNLDDYFTPRGFVCDEFVPTFITPAQFAERAGKEYPERALVYFYHPASEFMDAEYWGVLKRSYAGEIAEGALWHCCAFGDLVPPDDWRPQ